VSVVVAQLVNQMIDRVQERACISLHPIDGIPVHGRKRCFAITLQKLAHANDYIQRRAQFVTDSFEKFRSCMVGR
jgi:hypothetical protein